MKPPITGMRLRSRSGISTRCAASRVFAMSGVAPPKRSSVQITSSECTCSPGSARIIIVYANRTDDSFSPIDITLSRARGVISPRSAMPRRIVSISSICLSSCLMNDSKKSDFCCTSCSATSSCRWRTAAMISRTRFGSCEHAASDASTRLFVTPESAETTTIGLRCLRSATISIAFATRSASPTEVPPNLMTIIAAARPDGRWQMADGPATRVALLPSAICHPPSVASQQSPRLQQLRVEDRRARGAANRVVHERDHAQVEHVARAEAADADGHAALAIAIEPRLRTVGRVDVVQRMFGREWKSERLRLAAERLDRCAHVFNRRMVAQLHGDRHQMSVDRRDAIHLRGDRHLRVDVMRAVPLAEDLARLFLDLVFLAAADERDHVVEDRVRRDAGIARAGDRLHGRDLHLVDAECALERREDHRQ